jgi:hypothetical protein
VNKISPTFGEHMSDDKNERGAADRRRVNLKEEYELQYWSAKFGCSAEQLRTAVDQVGVMASDVESYLKKHHGTSHTT